MDRKTRIAVVGAGLGGMTVAGFLQRAGFSVTIYEQAPAFSRIGAGIILSANVMKVLRRLGLEQMVVEIGIKANCYVSRAWDTGDDHVQDRFRRREARPGSAVPMPTSTAATCTRCWSRAWRPARSRSIIGWSRSTRPRDAIRLVFENGAAVDADIVIGADGVNSKVREYLLGSDPPRYVGMAAHRAIFPTTALRGFGIPDCTKWWGPDRHILVYFMTSRRDEVYVIGVVPRAPFESDAASLPSSRAELFQCFDGFHADLLRVIEVTTDVTVWPIFDRERNDRWSGGRIVLLGDACHPMRPFMAAGGAMAIEDAAILSRCLAQFDEPAEAYRWYEATRIERVGETQRLSIENSWMRGATDTDWFYCYDPCTAPLHRPA